ncbi:MAG TPA: PKD domain-containing protein [Solirubrobacteraceae bacterium]|nr:PKD domain-containing protein [Solirubrobacteraceae bacterium]
MAEIGGGVEVGLQPHNGTTLGTEGQQPASFSNENGNVVLQGTTSDYAIYWDPNDPTEFHHEWVQNLDGFFQALGEAHLDTPFGVLAQYRDRSNKVGTFQALFKGSYSDTVKFPAGKCTDPKDPATRCLTDAQLREQLESFIATHRLPTGMDTVYYLLMPPGVTVCLEEAGTRCSDYILSAEEETHNERKSVSYKESFCSYHGAINPNGAPEGDSDTVLYAAIPWTGYASSFDCQDGGWNPEKHGEKREKERELTTAEEEALAKDTTEQRNAAEEARRLEGPHIEEPNQQPENDSQALSDVVVNQIAEEEMNTVTDPLLNSWHDSKGDEATDLCRNFFASTAGEGDSHGEIAGSVSPQEETEAGSLSNVSLGARPYYINNVFSLSEGACSGGLGLVASFTAPNPVNAGELIGVDGMESEVSLIDTKAFGPIGPPTVTYGTFSWNFGDGTPEVTGFAPGAPTCESPWLSPCAASAFHSYQYGGTYKVTLTITDVDGNKTSVTHEVTVNGSPPPSNSSGSSTQTLQGTQSTQSSGSSGSNGVTPSVPAPIAAAAILRQSLRQALHKGLAVSYSVNEEVAGRFEVLLSRAIARRLGISGTLAAGMPAGSSPQLVIAKAILVTTKGGHSSVRIEFSKRTAARLAHAHKVALTLRLTVRNASSSNPQTTTVVSAVTLGG